MKDEAAQLFGSGFVWRSDGLQYSCFPLTVPPDAFHPGSTHSYGDTCPVGYMDSPRSYFDGSCPYGNSNAGASPADSDLSSPIPYAHSFCPYGYAFSDAR